MATRHFYGPVLALGAILALAGCSADTARSVRVVETVRVEIPVAVRREPPAELLEPYRPGALPGFVSPSDPAASSALTPEGERRLRLLILDLVTRETAWREWAGSP